VRIVLDTNVFVSGVFFSDPPTRILEAWRDARLTRQGIHTRNPVPPFPA